MDIYGQYRSSMEKIMTDLVEKIETITDGYFHESLYRSAPYFDLRIDGITELN